MSAFEDLAEPRIVAADDSLVLAYKPAGMHCAPLPAAPGGEESLAHWVFRAFPEVGRAALPTREEGGPAEGDGSGKGAALGRNPAEGGLVHRLDRDTSGLVLFARNPDSLAALLALQAAEGILKSYRLLCRPSRAGLPGSRPLLRAPAGPSAGDWLAALEAAEPRGLEGLARGAVVEGRFRSYGTGGARVACLAEGEEGRGGRSARAAASAPLYATRLEGRPPALEEPRFAAGEGSLALGVAIRRGFRHQIRAHLAWIGLPLLGDGTYGGAPAPRLYLEACGLRLLHPATGRPLEFDL